MFIRYCSADSYTTQDCRSDIVSVWETRGVKDDDSSVITVPLVAATVYAVAQEHVQAGAVVTTGISRSVAYG